MAISIPSYVSTFSEFPSFTPNVRYCGCCPVSASVLGSSTGPYAAEYLVYINSIVGCRAQSLNVSLVWDFGLAVANRVDIDYQGGGSIYSSGCQLGTGSGSVVIPPGNTEVIVRLWGACNAPVTPDDVWSLIITCT